MKLRAHLRVAAVAKLADLQENVRPCAVASVDGTSIEPEDLIRSCLSKRTATLEAKLVTALVNDAEAEIIEQYNDQRDLPLSDSDKVSLIGG